MAKRKNPSARRSQQRTMLDAAKSGAVQVQKIALKASRGQFEVLEVGVVRLGQFIKQDRLDTGCVGYVMCGIKTIQDVGIGDTGHDGRGLPLFQPPGHLVDLRVLGGLDAGGQPPYVRRGLRMRLEREAGHIDGLLMVGNHRLGEGDVGCGPGARYCR